MSILSSYYKKAKKAYDRSDIGKTGGKIVKTAEQIAKDKKKAFNKAYSSLSTAQKKTYDDLILKIKNIGKDAKNFDFSKSDLGKGINKKIELAKDTVKRSDLGSGAVEKSLKRSDFGRVSNAWNRLGKDASKTRTDAYRRYQKQRASFNKSMRNRYRALARQGNQARNQIGKQLSTNTLRNFSLRRAYRGTVKGASDAYRRSDWGKAMRYLGKRTGYTGSDLDKGLRKVEKEGSNVVNQTVDFVSNPMKVTDKALKKAGNYITKQLYGTTPKEEVTKAVLGAGKIVKNTIDPPKPTGPTSKEGYGLTKKKKRSGELVGNLMIDPTTIAKRKQKFAKGKGSLKVRPTQNTLGGLKIRKSTGVGLS